MGPKSLLFVEKAWEYAQTNSYLVPPFLDMAAFGIDFSDAHSLWTLQTAATQLMELVSDTQLAAGSEAYQNALVVYNLAKAAAAQDVPGAKAVYEEMRKRFPKSKRRGEASEGDSEDAASAEE